MRKKSRRTLRRTLRRSQLAATALLIRAPSSRSHARALCQYSETPLYISAILYFSLTSISHFSLSPNHRPTLNMRRKWRLQTKIERYYNNRNNSEFDKSIRVIAIRHFSKFAAGEYDSPSLIFDCFSHSFYMLQSTPA